MSLLRQVLLGIIAIEVGVGTSLVSSRLLAPSVPVPGLSGTDAFTAGDLQRQAEACKSADQWRQMGEAYMATGFFREAEACHRVACQMAPRSARLAFEWGFALERMGELEEANAKYELAARLGHDDPAECYYFIGRNLLRQENVAKAQRALARAGELPAARFARAKLRLEAGDAANAEQLADSLLAQFPSAMQPLWLKLRIALARGDKAESRKYRDLWEYSRKRLENPFDRDVLRLSGRNNSLGLARRLAEGENLLAEEEFEAAEKQFAAALAVRWNAGAADQRADAVFQTGRKEESLALLLELLERDGPTVSTLERLGDTYSDLGREHDARQAWERAARLGPGTTAKDACFKLGYSYERAGHPEKAKPWLATGNCSAGIDLLREGKFGDAKIMLGRAIDIDPGSPRAWFHLGESERQPGNIAEATLAYRRCLALDPGHGKCAAALLNLEEAD